MRLAPTKQGETTSGLALNQGSQPFADERRPPGQTGERRRVTKEVVVEGYGGPHARHAITG